MVVVSGPYCGKHQTGMAASAAGLSTDVAPLAIPLPPSAAAGGTPTSAPGTTQFKTMSRKDIEEYLKNNPNPNLRLVVVGVPQNPGSPGGMGESQYVNVEHGTAKDTVSPGSSGRSTSTVVTPEVVKNGTGKHMPGDSPRTTPSSSTPGVSSAVIADQYLVDGESTTEEPVQEWYSEMADDKAVDTCHTKYKEILDGTVRDLIDVRHDLFKYQDNAHVTKVIEQVKQYEITVKSKGNRMTGDNARSILTYQLPYEPRSAAMVRDNVQVGGTYEPEYPANSYYELKPGDQYRPMQQEVLNGQKVPYFGMSKFGGEGTVTVCPALVDMQMLHAATQRTMERDYNLYLEEDKYEREVPQGIPAPTE